MPLPIKSKNEKDKEFITRCMGDKMMNKDFKDNKQRAAVCYAQLKKAKKKASAKNEDVSWDKTKINGFIII